MASKSDRRPNEHGVGEELLDRFFVSLERRLTATLLQPPERAATLSGRLASRLGVSRLAGLVVLAFGLDLFAGFRWVGPLRPFPGPLVPFVLGGAAVWWWAAGHDGFVARTGIGLAAQLMLGLTVVSVALLGLNVLPGRADPQRVHGAELLVSHIRLTLNQWADSSGRRNARA